MESIKRHWHKIPKSARKIIIFIVGVIVIIAGILMLVLPGPGWATIFLGLAILATEFERAEKVRSWVVARFKKAIKKTREKIKR